MTEMSPTDWACSTMRRYARFRRRSALRHWCLGSVEFVFGVWFVYAFIAPVICR